MLTTLCSFTQAAASCRGVGGTKAASSAASGAGCTAGTAVAAVAASYAGGGVVARLAGGLVPWLALLAASSLSLPAVLSFAGPRASLVLGRQKSYNIESLEEEDGVKVKNGERKKEREKREEESVGGEREEGGK